MGGTPDTWVTPDSDSSCSNRPPPTPPPVRDASCGGEEAFPPAGASAVADSLQELSLSGVTHVSGVPPIYLTSTYVATNTVQAPHVGLE